MLRLLEGRRDGGFDSIYQRICVCVDVCIRVGYKFGEFIRKLFFEFLCVLVVFLRFSSFVVSFVFLVSI